MATLLYDLSLLDPERARQWSFGHSECSRVNIDNVNQGIQRIAELEECRCCLDR